MSIPPEDQGKPPTNDEANPSAQVVSTASQDCILPYFWWRVAIMTSVIFGGWIFSMLFSNTWNIVDSVEPGCGKTFGEAILGLLYLPMELVFMLLVVLPLQWMHVSSSVIETSMVIYGLIASPLVARLFYRGWHGKGRDPIVPQPKTLDNPQSPDQRTDG